MSCYTGLATVRRPPEAGGSIDVADREAARYWLERYLTPSMVRDAVVATMVAKDKPGLIAIDSADIHINGFLDYEVLAAELCAALKIAFDRRDRS